MVSGRPLLTEDTILYMLHKELRAHSTLYFKIKHTITIERSWYYAFGPDVDLMEVRSHEEKIVGYEVKGETKRGWPARYKGLDEALAYLELPYVMEGDKRKYFGGGLDQVYLVHGGEAVDVSWARVVSTTPVGLIVGGPAGKIKTVLEAKPNPYVSADTKMHLLRYHQILERYSENSRTFRNIRDHGLRYLQWLEGKDST